MVIPYGASPTIIIATRKAPPEKQCRLTDCLWARRLLAKAAGLAAAEEQAEGRQAAEGAAQPAMKQCAAVGLLVSGAMVLVNGAVMLMQQQAAHPAVIAEIARAIIAKHKLLVRLIAAAEAAAQTIAQAVAVISIGTEACALVRVPGQAPLWILPQAALKLEAHGIPQPITAGCPGHQLLNSLPAFGTRLNSYLVFKNKKMAKIINHALIVGYFWHK